MNIYGYETSKAWDYENGFYLTTDTTRIGKLVAHWELYRMITNLPGHVVELGVFKGASLIRFATFRNLLESEHSRKIIGFDAFGDFPPAKDKHDQKFVRQWQSSAGCGILVDELQEALKLKNIHNVELIQGDIRQTLPSYLEARPHLRVALLHIDVDVYEPALCGLEQIWDRIVPGGVLVLDDYGTEAGGTRAVEAFFADKQEILRKFPFSHASPAFIVKNHNQNLPQQESYSK
jgi:SAM-dependent methyltransferase